MTDRIAPTTDNADLRAIVEAAEKASLNQEARAACVEHNVTSCNVCRAEKATRAVAGRCAKCRENTVLERMPCETCEGEGQVARMGQSDNMDMIISECADCGGQGYTDLTPCCGRELLDPSDAVDAANDRARDA